MIKYLYIFLLFLKSVKTTLTYFQKIIFYLILFLKIVFRELMLKQYLFQINCFSLHFIFKSYF